MDKYQYLDWEEAKKNLNRQGTKVLHYIVDAYQRGALDQPDSAMNFCSLLACICEGKVIGTMDEEKMKVKWTLKPEYEEQVQKLYEAFMEATGDADSEGSSNVIKGPWKK